MLLYKAIVCMCVCVCVCVCVYMCICVYIYIYTLTGDFYADVGDTVFGERKWCSVGRYRS